MPEVDTTFQRDKPSHLFPWPRVSAPRSYSRVVFPTFPLHGPAHASEGSLPGTKPSGQFLFTRCADCRATGEHMFPRRAAISSALARTPLKLACLQSSIGFVSRFMPVPFFFLRDGPAFLVSYASCTNGYRYKETSAKETVSHPWGWFSPPPLSARWWAVFPDEFLEFQGRLPPLFPFFPRSV